jgi:hypothetical protein
MVENYIRLRIDSVVDIGRLLASVKVLAVVEVLGMVKLSALVEVLTP